MIQDFFGFQKTSPQERTQKVKDVFTSVSNRYDLMNDLMSLGIHRYWKKSFVHDLPLRPHQHILDVAGGTGDIAFQIMESYPHLNLRISLCDLTPSMLHVGRDRGLNDGHFQNLDWICGNAESLPLPDESVDIYTISFGLRNVTHLKQALDEAYRVLKPGGHFVCLEFSKVQNSLFDSLYQAYSFHILPTIGEWVANDRASYQYLVESIAKFPSQEELISLLKDAHFEDTHWKNFLNGVSCIHRATKPL